MPTFLELLWAFFGVLLTMGSTFIPASVTNPLTLGETPGFPVQSLNVTYQIGAVLLIGCLSGPSAAILSQIAYLILGLTLLPIFSLGGGWSYLQQPTFGYLLGFIPGAWVCGWLAFKVKLQLESLAFSALCGLLTIHLVGIIYLSLVHLLSLTNGQNLSFFSALVKYTLSPFPSHLAIVCAVTVISFIFRRLMSR